jgi:hypothetical protein
VEARAPTGDGWATDPRGAVGRGYEALLDGRLSPRLYSKSRDRGCSRKMSTLPKPFVFVLMPLDAKFNDIYKFGIKGAADEVGAYAERIDEQIFTEGILDRLFNQISRADVIVADMTGRNPNVFYEVGYARRRDCPPEKGAYCEATMGN